MRNATPAAMATSKSIGSRSDGAICITVRPTQTAKTKQRSANAHKPASNQKVAACLFTTGFRTPQWLRQSALPCAGDRLL